MFYMWNAEDQAKIAKYDEILGIIKEFNDSLCFDDVDCLCAIMDVCEEGSKPEIQ